MLTIAELETAATDAGTAFSTAAGDYGRDPSAANTAAYALAAMAYAGKLGQLARGLNPTTAALQDASNQVARYTQALADAQATLVDANPNHIPAYRVAVDVAVTNLRQAQEQYAKVNTITQYPVIGF